MTTLCCPQGWMNGIGFETEGQDQYRHQFGNRKSIAPSGRGACLFCGHMLKKGKPQSHGNLKVMVYKVGIKNCDSDMSRE